MWMLFFVFSILGIGYDVEMAQLATLHLQTQQAQAREDQQAIGVLLTGASAYVAANPGANGPIPLGALNLPNWYHAAPGASVVVQSPGIIYCYFPTTYTPESNRLIAALTAAGFTAGYARGGSLYNTIGAVIASTPPAIPYNATTLRYQ